MLRGVVQVIRWFRLVLLLTLGRLSELPEVTGRSGRGWDEAFSHVVH